MNIICNGKPMALAEGLSLEELIRQLELNPDTVVAECDSRIVLREEYAALILKEGADVELIRFVGGG